MLNCVDRLLVGTVAPLGPRASPSGIAKTPALGRLWLHYEGFLGDEQGDRKNHGGREKAVHHYPYEHYALWREELGDHKVLRSPGAFGENLSSAGLTEATVAVGDTYRVGAALIQVSQGRQPCWKLNFRFEISDMARRVQDSGRTGWYYRVLEPGYVEAGDQLTLVDRLSPAWTIARLWRALYIATLDFGELAAMSELTHLPESWRTHATKRLSTRAVEDWTRRLKGDGPGV